MERSERRKTTAAGTFQCEECGKSFTFRANLIRHKNQAHFFVTFPCSICYRSFRHKTSLQKHRCEPWTASQYLQNDRPLTCEECGRAFTKHQSLAAHTATHFSSSALSCGVCNKHFTDKYSVKRHLKTHLGVRDFVCVECGREYSQKGNLTRHMRSCHSRVLQEEGEGVQGKRSIEELPVVLHRHSIDNQNYRATSNRPFECEECGKQFTRRSILKRHVLTHSEKKQYKCGECGKGYSRKDVLAQHTRMHYEGKDKICDHCGKAFVEKSSLRMHILTHLPKRYKCKECDKEFIFRCHLLYHIKNIHTRKEEEM